MEVSILDPETKAKTEVFAGGGEMGATMRALDWTKTPLGPVASWPLTLRMMVRFLLANRFPLLLWWGPQFCQLYNDPYRPVLGTKHPNSMGQPASQCFPEIWDIIGPLIQTPFDGGPATWMEDLSLEVHRHGFAEETHFTVAYSPVPDDTVRGGIGGVLATVHEISEKVVGERRLSALRDLGAGSGETRTVEELCVRAAETLTHYAKDVPFALLYLIDSDRRTARLVCAAGLEKEELATGCTIDLGDPASAAWPISEVLENEEIQIVRELPERLGRVPPGPWSDPPDSAAVLPIRSNVAHQIAGFMVAGLSPRLRFDDSYRSFLELAASQIATAVASARAYEEERKRAEALAEIDRAKTAFFTNISHEFRTPLTLLLGPLEDALAEPGLPPRAQEGLRLAYRNSLRLLKMVNALLDFSRIEAGRMQAVYEPVDLAIITADLASVFRSAIERAGVELIVDCRQLDRPVYVDREMWEKIVLNLLSNAFKFTLRGEIAVTLRVAGDVAAFTVRDSGTGISAEELPHIFERFYRAKGSPGRSYEGSGIGLALVQELVKLHGGTVRVESEYGRGSAFTVLIPFGSAHLPADRIGAARSSASTATGAVAFVEEALRWLPADEDVSGDAEMAATLAAGHAYPGAEDSGVRARVLLADDNADMREYVRRLLAAKYDVETVNDGEAALEAVLERMPDLVVSDVMMPKLDGFGLLKAIRADERTATIPVILLSARAGEESRVEGVAARADGYIVKPFTARELVARVETQLALSRIRREAGEAIRQSEERFRALVTASSDAVYRMGPDWSEMRQLHGRDFIADTDEPSHTWLQRYIPADDQSRVMAVIHEAIRTRSVFELEHRVVRVDGSTGWTFSRAIPLLNANGEITEWFGTASDVTATKQAQETLGQSLAKLSQQARLLDLSNDAILVRDHDDRIKYWNRGATEIYGYTSEEAIGRLTHELLRTEFPEPLERIEEILSRDGRWSGELIHTRKDGTKIFIASRWAVERDGNKKTARILETNSEITQRKQAEDALRRSEKLAALGRMAATVSHEINNPLESLVNLLYLAITSEGLPSETRKLLAEADAELQRVAHITRQALGFYRESIAAGRVSVNALIESVIALLKNKIGARHVHIEKQWRVEPEIKAVAGELRQVFSNLLMNCLDAVDEGGTVKMRVGLCTLRDDRPGIRITFSDNGKGIEAATRSRIFEPLFTTKGEVGTGLGLWVSKQIIEKHKGRIQVRSSTAGERRGSTFSILLAR